MHIHDTMLLAAESANIRAELRKILESSYNILEASNEEQLRLLLNQNRAVIAGMLLDIKMTSSNGEITLASLHKEGYLETIPVISVITTRSIHSEKLSLDLGAYEVINHPFRPAIVRHRVNNIVSSYYTERNMESLLEKQADAIRNSYEIMVDTLSSLIEYRSIESGQHVLRIRRFTKLLLEEVARSCPEYLLTPTSIQAIASASALHDIGKISIPDAVLNKPGRLTTEEFELMKTHTTAGSKILESFKNIGNETYLRYAYNICRYHHERWDGNGYPEKLSGDNIPICAQVVGLVDAYDALTTDRVYKKAIPYLDASNMIINGECGVFSPKLLECFKHVRGTCEEIARSYADGLSPKSDAITMPLPPPKSAADDSLQVAITKYQALLHHFNAITMEVDLESGVYHLLYDPYLDFAPIQSATTFMEAMRTLADKLLHPDDRHLILDRIDNYLSDFLASGQRKITRSYRIRCSDGIYRNYEATTIRINTSDNNSKKALIIWHREDKRNVASDEQTVSLSSKLVMEWSCRYNKDLTLEPVNEELIGTLGYTKEEFAEKLGNSFAQLIVPERRKESCNRIATELARSNYIELPISLCCKDGTVSSFLAKGYLSTNQNGVEMLTGILCNFDRVKGEHESFISSLSLYRTIIEEAGDILFEWDIKKDRLICSPKWKERFGYDNISENASVEIAKSSHLHPDDVDIFRRKVAELAQGESRLIEASLRFLNSNGSYIWTRVRATSILGDDGNPIKLVGLISDIDNELRHSQRLMDKAERDSLTKMLNKEACRERVEHYLSEGNTKKGALIIIDLDNFKEVNDRYGHLFGDTVLINISEEISGMFRDSDIISRIGGDEFLVFMPEMTNRALIDDRCRNLINNVQSIYNRQLDIQISCSVGIALSPEHGTSYFDLYQKADVALYQAKMRGKGVGLFYDTDFDRPDYFSTVSKKIDSNDRLGVADNSLIEYVFQRLYDTSDIEETINSVLEIIGKQLNVSRVYIFENNFDNTACNNTFEWCNEGISPQIENLQNIDYEIDVPNLKKSFDERGIFYCVDITTLPEDLYAALEPQGVRSLLMCAIRDNGVFRGYVGIDECVSQRIWTKEQINLVTFLSQMVSVFLLKERAQKQTMELNADLKRVLESQYAWVYVIEAETYKMKFLNGKVAEVAPNAKKDALCYKALMGADEPCEMCPIKLNGGKGGTCRIYNRYLDLNVNATADAIHWAGQKEWLLTCRQVEEKVE